MMQTSPCFHFILLTFNIVINSRCTSHNHFRIYHVLLEQQFGSEENRYENANKLCMCLQLAFKYSVHFTILHLNSISL